MYPYFYCDYVKFNCLLGSYLFFMNIKNNDEENAKRCNLRKLNFSEQTKILQLSCRWPLLCDFGKMRKYNHLTRFNRNLNLAENMAFRFDECAIIR